MNARKIALALAAGTALMAAAPAFADPPSHWDHRAPAYGWRAKPHHHHYYRGPAYVYYPARPVVIAPPPVVYAPPPVYYGPPAPVFYGHIPVSPGVQIGFRVRL
jgi:hypothetical protein